jgi:anti-sigma-K factor RskA
MNLLHPPRLSALAREHALAQLRGGARRRFEQLLEQNDAARRELARWQEELATLAAAVPPLAPRERVWAGLQQRLGLRLDAADVADAALPWWQRLFAPKLLGGALAGVMLGVVTSMVVIQRNPDLVGHELRRDGLPASYVGLLSDAAGKPTVLLSSRRHGRVLTVKMLQALAAPAGTTARLWAFPKGGAAPFLVGTAPASGTATIALPDSSEKLFFHVERLGISFEPEAASAAPTSAAPSTPLVVSGPCVKLW